MTTLAGGTLILLWTWILRSNCDAMKNASLNSCSPLLAGWKKVPQYCLPMHLCSHQWSPLEQLHPVSGHCMTMQLQTKKQIRSLLKAHTARNLNFIWKLRCEPMCTHLVAGVSILYLWLEAGNSQEIDRSTCQIYKYDPITHWDLQWKFLKIMRQNRFQDHITWGTSWSSLCYMTTAFESGTYPPPRPRRPPLRSNANPARVQDYTLLICLYNTFRCPMQNQVYKLFNSDIKHLNQSRISNQAPGSNSKSIGSLVCITVSMYQPHVFEMSD